MRMHVQAGARKLFRERAWPDMVGRHKAAAQGQGRRRLRTVAPTANAEFASKHEQALVQAFGADGAKLMGMDTRRAHLSSFPPAGRPSSLWTACCMRQIKHRWTMKLHSVLAAYERWQARCLCILDHAHRYGCSPKCDCDSGQLQCYESRRGSCRAFAKAASEVSGRCKKFTQEFMQQKKGRLDLASLSPWLANFSAGCSGDTLLPVTSRRLPRSISCLPGAVFKSLYLSARIRFRHTSRGNVLLHWLHHQQAGMTEHSA